MTTNAEIRSEVTITPQTEFKIMEMRRDGLSLTEIAAQLGLSMRFVRDVNRRINDIALANLEEMRRDMWLMHIERTEFLYAKARAKLETAETLGSWLDCAKFMLTVLARQANVMGLDNNMGATGPIRKSGFDGRVEWWNDPLVSPERIMQEMKRQGFVMPEPFIRDMTGAVVNQ